jgi:hypothetical protein
MANRNNLAESGAPVAKADSNPDKHVELGQFVVLIRLPYLPSKEQTSWPMAERAVPLPVTAESKMVVQAQPPLERGSSGTAEVWEQRLTKWFSFLVSLADSSKRHLSSVRSVASDWKTAGFVVLMVLILSALLLPRRGTSPSTEMATHGLPEALRSVDSKKVSMPLDPEERENLALASSAPSPEGRWPGDGAR